MAGRSDSLLLLTVIVTLFVPPVGVFIVTGCSVELAVNILLTLLGFFPGLIHALFIELTYYRSQDQACSWAVGSCASETARRFTRKQAAGGGRGNGSALDRSSWVGAGSCSDISLAGRRRDGELRGSSLGGGGRGELIRSGSSDVDPLQEHDRDHDLDRDHDQARAQAVARVRAREEQQLQLQLQLQELREAQDSPTHHDRAALGGSSGRGAGDGYPLGGGGGIMGGGSAGTRSDRGHKRERERERDRDRVGGARVAPSSPGTA